MHGVLDFIFPPRCAGCDRPGSLLCVECGPKLALIKHAAACPRCGAPRAGPCAECGSRGFAFSSARCACLLEPPASRAIVLLKDGCERRYAQPLAEWLGAASVSWLQHNDVLVPVPASPGAVRRRGFDHAADITRCLSRLVGLPSARLLVARHTLDQRVLDRESRFANRAQAFALRAGAEIPGRVVLVDDVFTTGATLDAAARVLRVGGCQQVRALAVARSCTPVLGEVKNGASPATLHMLSPGSVVADASAS